MERPEVPLEQVHEDIHHHAAHAAPGGDGSWTRSIAFSTAIIAGLAALASLLTAHTETEAMHAKMEAVDQWGYYQAKSIKLHVADGTALVLDALGKPQPQHEARERYEAEMEEIEIEAKSCDRESAAYLAAHTWYGYSVTLFQIAIALGAISALTRRRAYWLISLGIGAIG